MKDIILSKNFKLSEFVKSPTAQKYGIDNTPNLDQVSNLQQLVVNVLQPLRDFCGTAVVIGSGFRCAKLNSHPAVGGVKNSQHMTGEAADIHVSSERVGNEMFEFIRQNCVFDQLIRERSTAKSTSWWIHVSFKQNGGNRRQVIENLIKNK